jgi:exopolysaccharide biosynthesis polyprenyl glycosylphosphotransferase
MPYTRLGLQRRRATSQALRLRLCATMAVADILALVTAFLAALVFQNLDDNWFAILFVTVPIYLGAAMNSGAYAVTALRHRDCGRVAALQALVFTFGALFLISYFFRIEQRLPRSTLLLTMIVATALVVLVRYSIAIVVRQRWRDALVMEMVVLDDVQPSLRASLIQVDAKQAGIAPDLRDPMMLNRFAELVRGVDRVVVACPAKRRKEWAMMLKGANVLGEIMVDDIADIGAFSFGRIDGHETLTVASGPLNLSQRIMKRGFDLVLCSMALLALAPVLIVTAIAIKLDSNGPVFFRQRRVGRGNAFFEILKFRSMRHELSDAAGAISASRDDNRITRVGRIIRRTSIDELPQLLNVLGGSMSLVGPRPHALGSLAGDRLFWDVDERYWHRHVLKPGITGLAQVRGFRGATHHRDDLVNRLQSDLEYAAGWSIGRDIYILFATFKVLVHKNTF